MLYRGMNGMKLPDGFLKPDKHNIRGGQPLTSRAAAPAQPRLCDNPL